MKLLVSLLLFLLVTVDTNKTFAVTDSLIILNQTEFNNLIYQNHPIAKQANLLVKSAKADLLTSRGNFDPSINLSNEQKEFAGKSYYNYTNSELIIPTWFGIKIYSGIENNSGDYTDVELTQGTSSYAGLSIPLLRDLLIDKRRASLKQSKLMVTQSEWEQKNILNNLILDASIAYSNWQKEYLNVKLFESALQSNKKRYELLKIAAINGDKSAIDTIEALSQLQNFQIQTQDAILKFYKTSFELNNFLWNENGQPIYLKPNVIPEIDTFFYNQLEIKKIDDWIIGISSHPKLKSIEYKINGLKIDRYYKFQSILPQLNLKYNFLQKGYDKLNFESNSIMNNNFKLGISFSMPIPNRTSIGAIKNADFKIKSSTYEMNLIENNLQNKIQYYYTEVINIKTQIILSKANLENFKKLFEIEKTKFELGESTLFMINSRELKMIESNQKLIELNAKFKISLANLKNASSIE